MRWIAFSILAYVAVGLQIGLGPFAQINGAGPDLVLIAVVFVALNAPRDSALLGGFLLGFMEDLVSHQPLGLYAFSYGLVAMFIVASQDVLQREHALTHFSTTLAGGVIAAVVLVAHEFVRPSSPGRLTDTGVALPSIHPAALPLFASAFYSAVLSVPALYGMDRSKRLFNFQSSRRKIRPY